MITMLNPLRSMAVLVKLGDQLLRATPILIPIYSVLLSGLHAIPIRNPNADLAKVAFLQQQIALLVTVELHLIWSLGKKFLRRRFLRA